MGEAAAHTAPMPMVKLAGIGRRFGTVAPVVALRGIDLEVLTGEWVAVVGASGSGKTTLLNIVGCLDRQSRGTYWFDGIDIADGTRARLDLTLLARNEAHGRAFQEQLQSGLSARPGVQAATQAEGLLRAAS